MFRRLFPRTGAGAWRDAPDDPLPARLGSVAGADQAEVDAAVARRKAAVLAAYRATRLGATPAEAPPAGIRIPARRRWAFALVAALLTLTVGAAGVAASAAGGPLYPVRLVAEEALLPAGGQQRLAAQLDRLDARVREAEAASAQGNRAGLEAALRAYRDIAAGVEAAGPETLPLSSETRRRLQERLTAQVGSLELLAPFDAAAIEEAIAACRHLGFRVQGQGDGPGQGGDDGSGASPRGGGGGRR